MFGHYIEVKLADAGLLSLKFAVCAKSGSFKIVASYVLVVISSCSTPLRFIRQHEVIVTPF